MTVCASRGYLFYPYESMPYLIGEIDECFGFQVNRKIDDATDDKFIGVQVNRTINKSTDDKFIGMQVNRLAIDVKSINRFQVNRKINDPTDDSNNGMQVVRISGDQLKKSGMEINREFPMIINHGVYLSDPYLVGSYLVAQNCALLGMTVKRLIQSTLDDPKIGFQIKRNIISVLDDPKTGMQVNQKINKEINHGFQVNRIKIAKMPMSIARVLYNVDQLRILCDFVSRGVPSLGGMNWSSPQGTEPGDFSVNNVNTDTVEQRTQSPLGTVVWEIRCNSGQNNSFVDTIALLEHNITSGAVVTFQGSDDVGFSTIKFNRTIPIQPVNSYFILPLADFPSQPAKYFRFIISDVSNPDLYIRIGTIVFGSSIILSQRTTFDLPLTFGKTHYKDTIETEGFTNVSNDRATRKNLGLNFSSIDFASGDYSRIAAYLDSAKTDLKCLVIPYPCKASLFAVYAKLTALPQEQHNAIELCGAKEVHTVDLQLSWDESL